MPHFIDTNLLIYSVSSDPQEREKQRIAQQLLDDGDCALSVQVLQEFYVQITRPTRSRRLSHDLAVAFIETWRRFPIQAMTVDVLTAALAIKQRHTFSYWDSAIIAAARALGCAELYTEDLQHGRIVEGVHIVDPFR